MSYHLSRGKYGKMVITVGLNGCNGIAIVINSYEWVYTIFRHTYLGTVGLIHG